MKKWEPLRLTLNNSKSEDVQGDYEDKVKDTTIIIYCLL